MSCAADGVKLTDLLRWWAGEYGLQVVLGHIPPNALVTCRLADVALSDAVSAACRVAGVGVSEVGGIWWVGDSFEGVSTMLVRVTRPIDGPMLEVVRSVVGEGGRVVASNGLLVASGSREGLSAARAMIGQLESVGWACYVVQVVMAELSERESQELGIDAGVTGRVAYSVAYEGGVKGEISGDALVDGVLGVARGSSSDRVVAAATVLCADGEQFRAVDGTRVPVARRAVSDQGTVSTLASDFVQTGLVVEGLVRAVGDDVQIGGRVDVSSVLGESEAGPTTAQRGFSYGLRMRAGLWYVLGAFETGGVASSAGGRTGVLFGKSSRRATLHVFGRVYAIGGPVPTPQGWWSGERSGNFSFPPTEETHQPAEQNQEKKEDFFD